MDPCPEPSPAPAAAAPSPGRLRAPSAAELDTAWDEIRTRLAPTPLRAVTLPTPAGGRPGFLKLETAQPTGAFKVRGGVAALAGMAPGTRVVSASAGNHALGMGHAAALTGVAVTVVTPETASPVKLAALADLADAPGSTLTLVRHGTSYEEAERHARRTVADTPGAVYVSAYSDWAVIAGAASIGRELGAQLGDDHGPLTVVVPVGGGGLASGIALWAGRVRSAGTPVSMLGVEVSASRAVSAAVAAGGPVEVPVGPSLADGLVGNLEPGAPTPSILARLAAEGGLSFDAVDEDELRGAMAWLFRSQGLVVEGAGAAGLAAVLAGRLPSGTVPVVLVTGRNVAADTYAGVLLDRR